MQRKLPRKGLPAGAAASNLTRCAFNKIEDQRKDVGALKDGWIIFGKRHKGFWRDVGPVLLHTKFAGQAHVQEAVRILRAASQQLTAEIGIRCIGAVN